MSAWPASGVDRCRGMESDRALDCHAFDGSEALLRFGYDLVVAGDHHNGHAVVRGDRRVDAGFGHRRAIDGDPRQERTRHGVRTYARRARRRCVIANEDHSGEARIDSFHHAKRAREGADDRDWNVVRKAIDQQRLAVTVRIADHELRRASLAGALNCGKNFAGHPLARLLVLEVCWPELIDRRDPGDPFHVRRDVDLERTLCVQRCSKHARQESGEPWTK